MFTESYCTTPASALAAVSTNVKLYLKVFNLIISKPWYGDRYWSKILHSTIPTPIHDLKVKVTDLELLCWSFMLKFLGPHYFQSTNVKLYVKVFKLIISKPYDGFGSCLVWW